MAAAQPKPASSINRTASGLNDPSTSARSGVAYEVGAELLGDQRLGCDRRVGRVLVVVGDERVLPVGRQPLEELLPELDVVGVAS